MSRKMKYLKIFILTGILLFISGCTVKEHDILALKRRKDT
jgi:hypothetical protein